MSKTQISPSITTLEASAILDISPERVQQLVRAGKLKASVFGRSYAIDRASVEARLESKPKAGRPKSKRARRNGKAK